MSKILSTKQVVYVEPNLADDFTSYDSTNIGKVYKSTDQEDLCIAVELEVEVRGRTYTSSRTGADKNIIMKWQSDSNGETVNFMSGTKIYTDQEHTKYIRSLTTNYTDCHLFDIENDGTCEMFGIKSIDISYDNFMVPEVTIMFTDVRGVSMFAQEEMRHNQSNGTMNGLINNDIQGSFFKCFFTFPYPKFTLKVKGFYGQMVSYELTCSDFRAEFDSNTGNFNVKASFVGYAFSFLTDVMVNALLAAPHSEYVGKQYWEDNVGTRFVVSDKNGIPQNMVKLTEIVQQYDTIKEKATERIKNMSDKEKAMLVGYGADVQNKMDNGEANSLKLAHQRLIESIQKIGENIDSTAGDVIIRTKDQNGKETADYCVIMDSKFDGVDEIKENVKAFNEEVRKYASQDNANTKIKDWRKNANECRFQYYPDCADIIDENGKAKGSIKASIREQIDNLKVKKFKSDDTYAEIWEHRYNSRVYIYDDSGLQEALNSVADVTSEDEKLRSEVNKEAEQKSFNEEFAKVFTFEPSVENITKIIMAHVETFITMVWRCSETIIHQGTKRSVGYLGVKLENFSDARGNDSKTSDENVILAPFPEVTQLITEGNSTKHEGAWIGDIKELRDKNIEEIPLVEGLLKGIDEAYSVINSVMSEPGAGENSGRCGVKYPLTFFDLFMGDTDNPFGSAALNHADDVFARFCVRAFAVMATQGALKADLTRLGELDAENFYEKFKNDPNLSNLARVINGISSDSVFNFVSSEDNRLERYTRNNPWYKVKSLISAIQEACVLNAGRYDENNSNQIIPVKNWKFSDISKAATIRSGLKTGKLDNFVTTTAKSDNAVWQTISYKEAPILYFKRCITGLSDKDDSLVSEIFGSENIFNFNGWYSSKVLKGIAFELYDKDGNKVENPDNILEYDDDGNLKNSSEVIIGFGDFFFNEKVAAMTEQKDRASYFLRWALPHRNSDIDIFNYFAEDHPTFMYMPAFMAAQVGASLYEMDLNKLKLRSVIVNFFKRKFDEWCLNEYPKIERNYSLVQQFKANHGYTLKAFKEALKDCEGTESVRKVFGKYFDITEIEKHWDINSCKYDKAFSMRPVQCEDMSSMLTSLMKVSSVCTMTRFNYRNDVYLKKEKDLRPYLTGEQLKAYFGGVVATLKNLLQGLNSEELTNNGRPASSDDVDLKVGVYAYIKMLYDKWLASNKQDSFYKLENLFDGDNPTFHFLDSVYNDIGKRLYINLSSFVTKLYDSQFKNGYSLLSMLSGLYADNKMMFLCVQNFLDLAHENLIDKMFKPVPYIDIQEPNNHPDFLVVFPYEPSSKLDVGGADFPDDGFYLNNEKTWPELIRGKSIDGSPIASFGVCYGQQYQNYFKNIQVDMNSPMSTEASIKAKFMIAGYNSGNQDNGARTITAGQDLYTIYSNNSYTCTVTMMGCAWVQPMMYFVLQNVPMFSGSYMIVKVNHQIQPGQMTTTFKGVRMSRNATRLVKSFLFGGTTDSIGYASDMEISRNSVNANIGNDCDWAYFDPMGTEVITPDKGTPAAYCKSAYQSFRSAGLTDEQARGVCANIYAESGFDPYVVTIDGNNQKGRYPKHGVGGGLCGFYYYGRAQDLFYSVYGTAGQHELDKFNAQVEPYWNGVPCSTKVRNRLREAGITYKISFADQIRYVCSCFSKKPFSKIREGKLPSDSAQLWQKYFECPAQTTDRWGAYGAKVNAALGTTNTITTVDKSVIEKKSGLDITNGIIRSLQYTMSATSMYANSKVSRHKLLTNDWFWVTATGTNAVNALFDIMISTYGAWYSNISWDVDNGAVNADAKYIKIHFTRKEPNGHVMTVVSNGQNTVNITKKEELNESLRLSLVKYFKKNGITDPQKVKSIFRSVAGMDNALVKEIFELGDVKTIQDCNSLLGK